MYILVFLERYPGCIQIFLTKSIMPNIYSVIW